MNNKLKQLKNLAITTASAGLVALGSAQAAVPTAISDMIDDVSTDASSLLTTYVIPAVATITGIVVLLKLGKRFANRIG